MDIKPLHWGDVISSDVPLKVTPHSALPITSRDMCCRRQCHIHTSGKCLLVNPPAAADWAMCEALSQHSPHAAAGLRQSLQAHMVLRVLATAVPNASPWPRLRVSATEAQAVSLLPLRTQSSMMVVITRADSLPHVVNNAFQGHSSTPLLPTRRWWPAAWTHWAPWCCRTSPTRRTWRCASRPPPTSPSLRGRPCATGAPTLKLNTSHKAYRIIHSRQFAEVAWQPAHRVCVQQIDQLTAATNRHPVACQSATPSALQQGQAELLSAVIQALLKGQAACKWLHSCWRCQSLSCQPSSRPSSW